MTSTIPAATVESWVRSYFKASQSGDAQVWFATFAEGAVVEDPVGTPPKSTREEILAQGTGFVEAFKQVGLYESFIHVNGLEAVAMWTGRAITHDDQSLSFEGIDLFEFNETGKITLLRGFWTPPPF
ncbi:MAG: nuclear transport factor 2 family protein [Cyanobacteria bacterium J06636_16]